MSHVSHLYYLVQSAHHLYTVGVMAHFDCQLDRNTPLGGSAGGISCENSLREKKDPFLEWGSGWHFPEDDTDSKVLSHALHAGGYSSPICPHPCP